MLIFKSFAHINIKEKAYNTTVITIGRFAELKKLEYLDISFSSLSLAAWDTICAVTSLKKLSFCDCALTDLPSRYLLVLSLCHGCCVLV